jgi:hypothetical protein
VGQAIVFRGLPNSTAVAGYPFKVQPERYCRFSKSLASVEFVTWPVAAS